MASYVALLRGISGNDPNQRMEKLRQVFERLGFTHVRTVIASGNVLFDAKAAAIAPLEAKIEKALAGVGVPKAAIVRTRREIDRLIASDPFEGKPHSQHAYQNVTFLKRRAKPGQGIPRTGKGYHVIATGHREICFIVDLSSSGTPVMMALLEKTYGKDITTRTWKTVHRIAAAFAK